MNANEVAILIRAKDEATKTLKDVGDTADKSFSAAEKSAGQFGRTLGDVGKIAGGFVLGNAIMNGPQVISGFVGAASDMNETLSKSNTVFGEQGRAIEKWASGAARDFGQSKEQALAAAGSFGNMFTQLGIGTDVAADMSMQMVELASDFASFHNADITEVLTAQQAAFRGEYDALQRFVPTINAASVEQKALAMTGKETTKELTQQEKALAVQAIMMENAGAAAGDFDRTASGLANQQRILSAEWENAQVKLGTVLLPMMIAVVGFILNDFIPGVKAFIDVAGPYITQFVELVRTEWAKFQPYYEENVKPALDNIIAGVQAVIGFITEHWPQIAAVVVPILNEVANQVETTVRIVMDILNILLALLRGDWTAAWQGVEKLVSDVWDGIKTTISNAKDFILGVLSGLRDIGVAMVGGLLEGAQSKLGELANWFFALPGKIVDQIPNPLQVLYSIGKQIIQGLINGIESMIGSLVSSVGGAISSIPSAAKKILGIFSPSRVMFGLGERVAEGFALGIGDGMKSMVIPEAGKMAAAVSSTIASSSTAAPSPSGQTFGGAVTNYNYTINVQALDGTSAAQIIMRELVKWERRGGLAPGTTRAVA